MNSPVVIVLAAGQGTRFYASGASEHKLDALLKGKTVLDRTLEAVKSSGLPWHLVRPDGGTAGMGDSIRKGITATLQAEGWLILPADLPLIKTETLRRIAAALKHHALVIPCYQMRSGHPVGFSRRYLPQLLTLTGDTGGREIVVKAHRSGETLNLAVDDVGIVHDIDTLADLYSATKLV